MSWYIYFWYDTHKCVSSTKDLRRNFMMTSSNGDIFRVTGLCVGKSPVTGEFSALRPATRSFYMFSLICALNKRLSKQSWGWWFETQSRSLWRHCNVCQKLNDVSASSMRSRLVISDAKLAIAWVILFHPRKLDSTKILLGARQKRETRPCLSYHIITNDANQRDLIAATGLVILLKLDPNPWNLWFFSARVTLNVDRWPKKK